MVSKVKKSSNIQKLPVYAEVPCSCDDSPEPLPDERQHNVLDFWCLVLVLATAAIAIGTVGNYFGMFTTPNDRLTQRNADLSEQLATSQSEINRIRECVQ